ncbi:MULTISPECIES: hypothetical protein [unclassified Streptomyces]|uniref:hypothetical protein n=1 Tax=unclassified Streptomyces TaxID=2593676 RepID=UPI00224D8E18|nr:hypothetical protein [Streptomyces sp. NBC_00047]MCX5610194.1 hypothetical protein [Streptomyces sp. NBC_00047]
MPGDAAILCQKAKDAFAKAKLETKRKLKELNDAERKLDELEAAQPPDTAAIEAQKAEVDQALANWKAARKEQKDRQEAVDDFCNP